jgi:hypothetical protein
LFFGDGFSAESHSDLDFLVVSGSPVEGFQFESVAVEHVHIDARIRRTDRPEFLRRQL